MKRFGKLNIRFPQIWGLGLILMLLVALACAPAEAPEPIVIEKEVPVEKEVVVVATPTPAPPAVAGPAGKVTVMVSDLGAEIFDIAFTGGTVESNSYGRIVQGFLISGNENSEMTPGIASDWGLSADGLTWAFTIRDGVKFHDGSDLTLEDVLWTFRHTIGPQALEYLVGVRFQTYSRSLDKVEQTGPDEVSITTKDPVTFLALDLSEVGPFWWGVLPKRATFHDEAEEVAYDKNPIGAGFMKLVDHVPSSVMKFERFDDYYFQPKNGFPEDRRVNFKELDLVIAPEEATRISAIRAGEADIVPASLGARKQVEAGGGRMVFGREGVYASVRLLGCYELQFPCNDRRVRQALDYAIDKEQIQQLLGGPEVMEIKGWGRVTPSTLGYTPELDPWPFDPDKARQLLAEAGYPGGEGFGKLIVNTNPATSMPNQVESAQLAGDFWRRELGLDVQVRVGDSTSIKKNRNAGKLKGQIWWRDNETRIDALGALFGDYGDPKASKRYHENPELFSLVQEAAAIIDPDEQSEALKKAFLRLREETYEIGVGYVNVPWAVGPRIATWEPWPLALYPSALHTITLK